MVAVHGFGLVLPHSSVVAWRKIPLEVHGIYIYTFLVFSVVLVLASCVCCDGISRDGLAVVHL